MFGLSVLSTAYPSLRGVLNEFKKNFEVQERAAERLEKIRSSSEVLKTPIWVRRIMLARDEFSDLCGKRDY